MTVILVYVAFVIVGDAVAVGVSYMFERISDTVGLLVFFALFILVFWASWVLAVRVTERYLIRET
jgi:hypothetical protein